METSLSSPVQTHRLASSPATPKQLLRRVMASDNTMVRACDVVFPIMLGSRELFLRFARFVDDLPGPLSESLLADSMRSAITLVGERCGLAPITVETHLRGFATLCEGLLTHFDHLQTVTVRDAGGSIWRATSGSLSDWKRTASPPFSVLSEDPPDGSSPLFLRLLLLSSIVDFADVVHIGDQWPSLTSL